MALTDKERAQLKALQDKEKEPEAAPIGRSLRANIDLGDSKQVALARKLGFLPPEEEEDDDDKKDDDDDKDTAPRQGGYFGDKKKK